MYCTYIYIYCIYIYIYRYIILFIFKRFQGQETFSAPSADKQTRNYDTECSNHYPSLLTLYIYINLYELYELSKMFQTKQIRQSFSCSLTYQKFPHQNQLVLSTASSFKSILSQESE